MQLSNSAPIEQAGVKEEDDDEDEEEEDGDEEVMVPEGIDVDPVVMSTLPHSMQVRSPTCSGLCYQSQTSDHMLILFRLAEQMAGM